MNNLIYLYENTLEELLQTIYFLIQKNLKPLDIVNEEKYVPSLLDETFKVPKKKRNIYIWFLERTNKNVMFLIRNVFLSEEERKELIIYYFLLNALKYPKDIIYRRNLKCVNKVLSISQYVRKDLHHLKGFLRFKELKHGYLYAQMSPENNVIFSLAHHFQKRLPKEKFIIKDVKRNILAIYEHEKLYFLSGESIQLSSLLEQTNEKEVEELWKTFFQTIAIKERENKKCQQSFMPKKYWQYMIEMESEYEKSNL